MNTLQCYQAALDLDGVELEFNNLIIILKSYIGGQFINIVGSYLKIKNVEIILDFYGKNLSNAETTPVSMIYASDYEPPYSKMGFIKIILINKMSSFFKYPIFIIGTHNNIEIQEFYFLNEVKNSSFIDNVIFQIHTSNFSLSNASFK